MPKKLKRFLLRYDPPGLGFEVAQGGDDEHVEIVHKDLPPASKIQGQEDIFVEVDRIIAEDDLLTRKRHRPALIQLLGRLYQVDVDSAHEEEHDSPHEKKTKHSTPKAADVASPLQEGAAVALLGLKQEMAVHNGELGVLIKSRPEKHKFEVRLNSNSLEVKIKGEEHIVLVAPKGTGLAVGSSVLIRGLRNHTELNGCLGRVVECHEESHRFEVRAVESGQLFRVKQENLVAIDGTFLPATVSKENRDPNPNATPRGGKKEGSGSAPVTSTSVPPQDSVIGGSDGDENGCEVGSIVELVGLKTAMAYNGQTAEILSVDRARSRYEIKLNDGSVKTIRAENVRLISRPSKTSPRTRRKDGASKPADRGK